MSTKIILCLSVALVFVSVIAFYPFTISDKSHDLTKEQIFEDIEYLKIEYDLDLDYSYSNSLDNYRINIWNNTTQCYEKLIVDVDWVDREEIDFDTCIDDDDEIYGQFKIFLGDLNFELNYEDHNYLMGYHNGLGTRQYIITTEFTKKVVNDVLAIDVNNTNVWFYGDPNG